MDIERVEQDGRGAFVVYNREGHNPPFFAEMTWEWRDGKMVILHTGVRDELRGQGAGRKLVLAAVEAARAEGFSIVAECPYARKVLTEDAQFADVLAG